MPVSSGKIIWLKKTGRMKKRLNNRLRKKHHRNIKFALPNWFNALHSLWIYILKVPRWIKCFTEASLSPQPGQKDRAPRRYYKHIQIRQWLPRTMGRLAPKIYIIAPRTRFCKRKYSIYTQSEEDRSEKTKAKVRSNRSRITRNENCRRGNTFTSRGFIISPRIFLWCSLLKKCREHIYSQLNDSLEFPVTNQN